MNDEFRRFSEKLWPFLKEERKRKTATQSIDVYCPRCKTTRSYMRLATYDYLTRATAVCPDCERLQQAGDTDES